MDSRPRGNDSSGNSGGMSRSAWAQHLASSTSIQHTASILYEMSSAPLVIHLVDGTYELFRHFYGLRRFTKGIDPPLGAVLGVLRTVLEILETGATHIGVATDH